MLSEQKQLCVLAHFLVSHRSFEHGGVLVVLKLL
jgi:hypothetical protein